MENTILIVVYFFTFKKVVEEDIQKLFKWRFRLDIRKYACCNRVIDNWNSLSAGCDNCNTINTFKKHLSPELEPELYSFIVSHLR